MNKVFLLLAVFISSISAPLSGEMTTPPTYFEKVTFSTKYRFQVFAHIKLSNGTEWKSQCFNSDEAKLRKWKKNDEIYIYTDDHSGIKLENVVQNSFVYSSIDPNSKLVLKQITKTDFQTHNWFFPDCHSITLSDGAELEMEAIDHYFERWEVGQNILLTRGIYANQREPQDLVVNLTLPHNSKYRDDRSAVKKLGL